MIDISKMNKCEVLAKLYNASKPQGMGFMNAKNSEDMTDLDAEKIIEGSRQLYFDYLNGRVMKVDLRGDTLDPRLYDRDNGEGAAAKALE